MYVKYAVVQGFSASSSMIAGVEYTDGERTALTEREHAVATTEPVNIYET
jgi:hypothetical protein